MAVLSSRQIHIFTGASGSGKSTFIAQSIQKHESGSHWPLQFEKGVKRFGVIIADRTSSEFSEHIRRLGVEHATVYGVADDQQLALSLLDHPQQLLKKCMEAVGDFDVLVLDPIALFMEGSLIDFKSVAKSLIQFNRLAANNDITILATHHTTKTRSDFKFLRPQDRISGSAAFQGYSGTQMVLIQGSESNTDWDTLTVVPHMTQAEEYRLVRGDDGYFDVWGRRNYELFVARLATCPRLISRMELEKLAALHGVSKEDLLGAEGTIFKSLDRSNILIL